MKKKTGINIVFFVFIAILILIISCIKSVNKPETGQLLKADRDFSALSVREGMHKAFLAFVADSGVLLRDKAWPVVGRNALADLLSRSSDTSFVLTWEPAYEKIAASGELGYTYGFSTLRVKATGEEFRGCYLTVWEKQADGSWKFVLDVGTDDLPEKSE